MAVPLAIDQEQQNFRLLELPSDLLDLLTSPNPPTLFIKSQESTAQGHHYAALCTSDKAYQLRQVQTSNSVLLTQPSSVKPDRCPSGVSAIASCTATLELHLIQEPVLPYLQRALQVYREGTDLRRMAGHAASKPQILAHIPLSATDCETAWRNLTAFECEGRCYQPAPKALVQVWKSVLTASIAENIRLDAMFKASDLEQILADEEYPRELLRAMLGRLLPEDQQYGQWISLDREKTIPWVGSTLLKALDPGPSGLLSAHFIDSWRDLLPESWRPEAQLEKIKGAYVLPTGTTIGPKNDTDPPDGNAVATTATASKAGTAGRNWHERLKKTRR